MYQKLKLGDVIMKKIKNVIRLVLLTVLSCLAFAFSSSAIVNGTFADAQKINVNTKYTGNISSYEDVDYYKFTISKDGYINISFNHDNLFNNNRYWSAELFDSSTNKICEYIFIGSEPSVKTKNTGLSAGTYYLKIAPYYLSTIKYTFSVNYKSSSVWETENRNNSFSQARTMKLNIPKQDLPRVKHITLRLEPTKPFRAKTFTALIQP